jgi:hypothetical protein
MGWMIRGSKPSVDEIFHACPDQPWGPPSLLYNGYRVFPRSIERPRRDADPSPPSSAVVKERVELYLYSPYGPYDLYRASVPVQGCTLPYNVKEINRTSRGMYILFCLLFWVGVTELAINMVHPWSSDKNSWLDALLGTLVIKLGEWGGQAL